MDIGEQFGCVQCPVALSDWPVYCRARAKWQTGQLRARMNKYRSFHNCKDSHFKAMTKVCNGALFANHLPQILAELRRW